MKRYKRLFEDEECNCDDKECPCNESCSKKKESCMCDSCEMKEANEKQCKIQGKNYSAGADKCYEPCKPGEIYNWKAKTPKCMPIEKEKK